MPASTSGADRDPAADTWTGVQSTSVTPGPLLAAHVAVDPGTARRRLTALRIVDRGAWRTIVREALDAAAAAGVGKPEAAALLGVGRRTLYDWVDSDEELRAHVASLALPTQGGPGHRRR